MPLVVTNNTETASPPIKDRGLGVISWRNYIPLAAILIGILLVAYAVSWVDFQNGKFSPTDLIHRFMAGFFLVFAVFKIIDLKGFARGYFTYDLLAKKFFAYGYIYPFIELGFGLAMAAGIQSTALLLTEMAVMLFSGLGVAIRLVKGEKFQCVCLGTFLKVPLTYVTLVEDFGMAALALILILAQ
jgi:hypothetical protein